MKPGHYAMARPSVSYRHQGVQFEWAARKAAGKLRKHRIASRLRRNRATTAVSLRIPADLVAELKRVAGELGFSGYEALIRAYIGTGLRSDLTRINGDDPMPQLLESLRRRGVAESVITEAIAETARPG